MSQEILERARNSTTKFDYICYDDQTIDESSFIGTLYPTTGGGEEDSHILAMNFEMHIRYKTIFNMCGAVSTNPFIRNSQELNIGMVI